jgi:hypothetical protein
MATYYVRTDGNNGNTGLGQGSGQAWATVAYALGSTSAGGSGLVAGDILYIAPGVYRGAITLGMASAASTISVIGDPLCTQFTGTSAGEVLLTVATSDNVVSTTTLISGTSKNFISWESINFDNSAASVGVNISGCQNWTFTKCTFSSPLFNQYSASNINAAYAAGVIANLTIDRCSFFGGGCLLLLCTNHSSQTNVNVVIKDVYCIGPLLRFAGVSSSSSTNAFGVTVFNCTTIHGGVLAYSSVTGAITIQNCVLHAIQGLESGASGTNITENYNRIYSAGARAGVATGANSVVGYHGLETLYKPQVGLPFSYLGANALNGPNFNSGIITGAPTFDFFTQNWTGANPDRGAVSWKQVSSITNYIPTERNASAITIAPGSTSQSIELYLGATGLTASTSGLSARYNRTRTASVSIPLVARTIDQAWTSGGFAEVDATNMPGVYRLDLPDAAVAAGASDVTIVVRGASGTNGAVLTVTLSSGGLTAAQTAAAVWDEPYTSHTTASTFGARTLKTTVDNRLVDVGTSNHIQSNVHAIVDSTAAADELKGALLHNGTDYIDSNLLGGASTRVFVGRFDLRQTGSETVDTIEVFTTDTPSFELQLTDGDGNAVPVTGATLGLRILDVASTVVETGTPTVEYGTGGIVRWTGPGTYLAIGCPVGNYRLFIDRTVSGTTTTFGPLQIRVQAQ